LFLDLIGHKLRLLFEHAELLLLDLRHFLLSIRPLCLEKLLLHGLGRVLQAFDLLLLGLNLLSLLLNVLGVLIFQRLDFLGVPLQCVVEGPEELRIGRGVICRIRDWSWGDRNGLSRLLSVHTTDQ